MTTYVNPRYAYRRIPERDGEVRHYPVVIVGAGPVGLAAAIDLGQRQVPVVVLDDDDTVSVGSRAICWSKRTLEILDRLGCAENLVQKGVRWNVGKVFHRDALLYQFDLLPEGGHRRPAFVNLQQYHVEECLVSRAMALPNVELRWNNKVVGVQGGQGDKVRLRVACPDREYDVTCDWLIAADGAKSVVRRELGLESEGQVFRDRFLIVDIRMRSEFPPERWFWFDPPFHPNQSVLLHRQADDVWRVDFQLGWEAEPEEEKMPERILPRLRAMLGHEAQFEIEWASVYTFSCRRMQRFRHGRVLFVGDAAHLLSPFGARGANSGIQDVDNLVWKLGAVLKGDAPDRLLDTFDAERCAAADENMRVTTASTDFITPKSAMSRVFRDAVLGLAKRYPFARKLVNSGRLSVPHVCMDSPLNTLDERESSWQGAMMPGAPAADAPVRGPQGEWLLDHLGGEFVLLLFYGRIDGSLAAGLRQAAMPCRVVQVGGGASTGIATIEDTDRLIEKRYDAKPGTCYLIRPDQIVCARWRAFDHRAVCGAIARASSTTAVQELACHPS
ncbi:MAG: FAD-dependent oxidoreductase [Pseudomonadota bacterium]|nr:FAD-dependent oxidoreductase [Pseudomonadota bacterium]